MSASDSSADAPTAFPFKAWVRRTCRRALVWGLAVMGTLALVVWWMRGPQGWNWDRGFGALLGYSALFWISLAKIWWTAGRPAALVGSDALYYQPLHTFRPRRVPYEQVLACGPKAETQSLRVVVERRGSARELFLNLGVIEGRHRFIAELGRRLEAEGLEPLPPASAPAEAPWGSAGKAPRANSWARAEWEEPT